MRCAVLYHAIPYHDILCCSATMPSFAMLCILSWVKLCCIICCAVYYLLCCVALSTLRCAVLCMLCLAVVYYAMKYNIQYVCNSYIWYIVFFLHLPTFYLPMYLVSQSVSRLTDQGGAQIILCFVYTCRYNIDNSDVRSHEYINVTINIANSKVIYKHNIQAQNTTLLKTITRY